MVVSTTFDGSRQSECLSPVLACLSKNGDNVGVARHVADMSPTYPTKPGNKVGLLRKARKGVAVIE